MILKCFLFQSEKQDYLFILTERFRIAILYYKPDTGTIITKAYGDVQVNKQQLFQVLTIMF